MDAATLQAKQYMASSPIRQSRGISSSAGPQQSELTPEQLMHAAKMARLSGFTYRPVEDLTEWLGKEGLQLVARGQTHFTRYAANNDLTACVLTAIGFYVQQHSEDIWWLVASHEPCK